jgi:hypothetical protein
MAAGGSDPSRTWSDDISSFILWDFLYDGAWKLR